MNNSLTLPRPRTVPTKLAAMALSVSEATIRKWASRGKLTRYGRSGRAEYAVDELRLIALKKKIVE
ncbi:transcriptional regulator [Saccharopolyspora shandongensis]|uniref:transcriptional regulator n=1 Tax=Saccharopolyspora shandongensis TaxID=418495 RepID=UPI0033DDAFE3